MYAVLTVRCVSSSISGAIHPSVPATPDRWENDRRPVASFLHRPKSEIIARTRPAAESGQDSSTLCGFISLCTEYRSTSHTITIVITIIIMFLSITVFHHLQIHKHKLVVCGTVFHRMSLLPLPSIFCCHLKSYLFSLSYPAFWIFSDLYSAHVASHHFGH